MNVSVEDRSACAALLAWRAVIRPRQTTGQCVPGTKKKERNRHYPVLNACLFPADLFPKTDNEDTPRRRILFQAREEDEKTEGCSQFGGTSDLSVEKFSETAERWRSEDEAQIVWNKSKYELCCRI